MHPAQTEVSQAAHGTCTAPGLHACSVKSLTAVSLGELAQRCADRLSAGDRLVTFAQARERRQASAAPGSASVVG